MCLYRSHPEHFVQAAIQNGVWKKHQRACFRNVILHSQQYNRAPKSASHRISFWLTPNQKEYGSIKYFLTCVYQDTPLLVSFVDWHPALQSPAGVKHLQLAQKAKAPSPYFINTLSIYSRILFIKNDKLPSVAGSQTMAIVDDLDFRYQ